MSEAARELQLFIDNDGDLYRQQGALIRVNLSKKFRKGNYDHALAVKLWKYLADNGAKKYAKEFSHASDWNKIFTVADRNEAAKMLADNWLIEMKAGNFHDDIKSNPASKKLGVMRYQTYAAWKRAVAKLGGKGGMYGDKDIGGAHRWESEGYGYYAEWDGEKGEIERVASEIGRQPNPKKRSRKGTSHPRRKSQITGRAPSKRLVARRMKNTDEGYFPNPYDARENYLGAIRNAYDALSRAIADKQQDLTVQARVAYLEGMVDAGLAIEALSLEQYRMWKKKALEMVKGRIVR